MESLGEELVKTLDNGTAFTIPIGNGIPIPESVVVTWCIMAFVVVVSIIFTRNLKIVPKRPQLYVEALVGFINSFFESVLGEEGKKFIPYLGTVLIYLGCSNVIGIFGITPPTKDLNTTAALAIMSIVLIEFGGLFAKGPKKWLKSFAEPIAIVAPINVLEIFIRPLSLCMRLFGNILGGFIVMELIKIVVPLFVPIPFSFYFDVFDGLIQAYIFVFLTSLFLKEAIE